MWDSHTLVFLSFHNKNFQQVLDIIHKAVGLVGEYEKANKRSGIVSHAIALRSTWVAPNQGIYKINSDVAMFEDGSMGFGAVVRDYVGDVMLSTCWKVGGVERVDVAEAMAARHALGVAFDAGLRTVILETDSISILYELFPLHLL